MNYRIRASNTIRKQLRKLPGNVRNLARQRMLSLSRQPRPEDARELQEHPGYYRIWISGRFRLIWHVIDDEEIVDILYLGPKSSDLYERLDLGR